MSDSKKETQLPTPAASEAKRADTVNQTIGFDEILRHLSLGISPSAPRLPEHTAFSGSMFGGYPKGFSSRLGAKGTLNFTTLRQIAERSPVLAAILSTRQHQRVRYSRVARKSKKGEVGFRVVHRRESDKDFKVPEGFQNLCREAEQMLLKPWNVYWNDGQVFRDIEPTNASFGSKFIEDLMVINRPCVELGLDPLRIPRAFGAIDGANVIPTFQGLKYLQSQHRDMPKDFDQSDRQYRNILQMVSDKYKINIDERTEYLYLLGGKPVAGFRHDEIILSSMLPTSDVQKAGYPKSLTEKAVFIILAEIMAMSANSRYFELGSMAETILAMKGNYDDKHVKSLQDILANNMSGVPGMFRVPLIALPGGADDLNLIQVKQNHKDMLFDVYIQKLTNLACAVFRMHPSEINEAPRAGDNSGSLNQAGQKQQINMAQEQGLEAILEHEKTVYDQILQRIDPDLVMEWEYGKNEQEQLNITTAYGTITTVNERRQMMGMDPLTKEQGGEVIDNQFVQAMKQQAQEAQMQQQQGQQGQPPGGPGEDDQENEDEESGDEEKSGDKPSGRDEDSDSDGGAKSDDDNEEGGISSDQFNRALAASRKASR